MMVVVRKRAPVFCGRLLFVIRCGRQSDAPINDLGAIRVCAFALVLMLMCSLS